MQVKEIQEWMNRAKEELMEQIRGSYPSSKGWEISGKYILGLWSEAERKNGW